ncbi:hypothetical protein [Aquipuribacter hungaricus]|uniref:Uncharacterized protein n=1 Tax=Aquipuribacter hungaricus TaxID=545624 RepID=A0ABV7WGY0_9MICO
MGGPHEGTRGPRGARPPGRLLRRVDDVDVAVWQDGLDTAVRRRPSLVLLDVEPYVAPWLTGQDDLDAGVARLAARWSDQPVLVVTNSDRVVSPHVLPAHWGQVNVARKPFTRLQVPPGAVVVGDQPLQDGLLAWRYRATFVRVPLPPGAPWYARATYRVFAPLSRLWLRPPR